MKNLIDYIKEHKDLDVIESPFNIIDALILTNLIYLPQPSDEGIQFARPASCNKFIKNFLDCEPLYNRCVLPKQDKEFAETLYNTKRFKSILISKLITNISEAKEEQFKAATFITIKGNIFISYCGTDITLVGWKENLNMSFEKATHGQEQAVKYLENVAKEFPEGKIFLGGHSKGGNLAMYAAIFASPEIQKRIELVFNFDGPGFTKEVLDTKNYQRVRNKIVSIVPYHSLVGMVFEHSDKIRIITSNGVGVLQHSPYTWKVKNGNFVYVKQLSKSSMNSHVIIRELINSLTYEERKELVDSIYQVATTNNKKKTTKDWGNNLIKILNEISSNYKTLSDEQKLLFNKTVKTVIHSLLHLKDIKSEKKATVKE